MSEPMEDKSLERSAEELASGLGMGVLGGRPEDREWLIRETTRALKLYAKQENAALQARLDLRSDYVKQTDAQIDEQAEMITTLQSQITALNRELAAYKFSSDLDDATIESSEEVVLQQDKEIADLQDQLTTIKELLNGASLHEAGTETGVSLVDDVRELITERDCLKAEQVGYKAQVAGQATYIGHLLTEIADYKERVFDYEKRIAEFLK